MSIKIQPVSDLHADHSLNYQYCVNHLYPAADVLLVAGDTCSYTYNKRKKFVGSVFSRFKTVIEIPGNHDSYLLSKDWEFADFANKKTEFDNGHTHYYVNNDFIDIDSVRIICTTLWSKVIHGMMSITRGMNDYRLIKGYTVDVNNDRYNKAVKFLDDTIEATPLDKKIIVMTHHLPLYELIEPKYRGNDMNEAYATNMSSFIYKNSHRISYWLHGHSHGPIQTKIDQTEFIRNPLGYLVMNEGNAFNPSLVLEI